MTRSPWYLLLSGCVATSTPVVPDTPPAGGSVVQPEPDTDEPVVPSGVSAMQRLTRAQLTYVLDDLFPGITGPAVRPGIDLALPHDVIQGFDNNADLREVSPLLVERHAEIAHAVAAVVSSGAATWVGCDTREVEGCTLPYLYEVAARAWRRPLDAADTAELQAQLEAGMEGGGSSVGLARGLAYVLQAPEFLYQVQVGLPAQNQDGSVPLTDHERAARLSLLLWQALPDERLRATAEAGSLSAPEAMGEQAARLLDDPRAERFVHDFVRQWLDLDAVVGHAVDLDTLVPEVTWDSTWRTVATGELAVAARAETLQFAAHTLLHGAGTLSALLTEPEVWVPDITGAYVHGLDRPVDLQALTCHLHDTCEAGPLRADEVEVRVRLDDRQEAVRGRLETLPARRAGILSTPGFLMAHAGARQPSPVHRGVTVLTSLLCEPPPPPPPGVTGLVDDVSAGAPRTNRERLAAHTQQPACASCHVSIDGAGLPFEHFGALGAWRDHDAGQPVDATGSLSGTDVDGPVADHLDLAQRLASSRQVHDCFVEHLWRYAVGRDPLPSDQPELDALQERFWTTHDGRVRDLVVDLVSQTTFTSRSTGGLP